MAFRPPSMNTSVPLTSGNSNAAPPSPPRMGFVAGAESESALNGFVGVKPPKREEGSNPQSRRQMPNFASPDPALSQSAFTQSQFTQNISAAQGQSAQARAAATNFGGGDGAGGEEQQGEESAPLDPRRESLRRYNQSNGRGNGSRSGAGSMAQNPFANPSASGGGLSGRACGIPPRPQQQRMSTIPQNNRGSAQQEEMGRLPPRAPLGASGTNGSSLQNQGVTSQQNGELRSTGGTSYVAYALADPGSAYKAFSGSTSWFRVAQLVVPEDKTPIRVLITSTAVKKPSDDSDSPSAGGPSGGGSVSYSLRLVDPSETPARTLWAEYGASNVDKFIVYRADLAMNNIKGDLLELQGSNVTGDTLLVSSVVLELV